MPTKIRQKLLPLRSLAIPLLLALTTVAIPRASAHHGPPTGPGGEAITTVRAEKVFDMFSGTNRRVLNNQSNYTSIVDGPDGNGEFILQILVNPLGHPGEGLSKPLSNMAVAQVAVNAQNNIITPRWIIGEDVWPHTECLQREGIIVSGQLTEEDTTRSEAIAGEVTSAGAGALTGALIGAEGGGPVGFIVGLVIGIAFEFDGDDDYGSYNGSFTGTGGKEELEMPLSGGADGGGTVHLSVDSPPTGRAAPECSPTPSPSPSPSVSPSPTPVAPEERQSLLFSPLHGVVELASLVRAERGNPGGLSEGRVQAIRDSYVALAVAMGEISAGIEIDAARGFTGVSEAIADYTEARAIVAEAPITALDLYSSAFFKAASARYEGAQSETDVLMPLDISTLGFISARHDADLHLPVGVFGADEPSELVVDAPAGVEPDVIPIPGSDSLFELHLPFGGAAPGTYEIDLQAFSGQLQSARTITVRLGPRPPTCLGRQVTLRGTSGPDRLDGSKGPDVIAGLGGDDEIDGRGGRDRLCGDAGSDTLLGGDGDDLLSGGSSDDLLEGGPGADNCDGGKGRDGILVGGNDGCEKFE